MSMCSFVLTLNIDFKFNFSRTGYASYKLMWKNFYPDTLPSKAMLDAPKHFYILRHNKIYYNVHNRVFDGNGKSVYDTRKILGVYSHGPLLFVQGAGMLLSVDFI